MVFFPLASRDHWDFDMLVYFHIINGKKGGFITTVIGQNASSPPLNITFEVNG